MESARLKSISSLIFNYPFFLARIFGLTESERKYGELGHCGGHGKFAIELFGCWTVATLGATKYWSNRKKNCCFIEQTFITGSFSSSPLPSLCNLSLEWSIDRFQTLGQIWDGGVGGRNGKMGRGTRNAERGGSMEQLSAFFHANTTCPGGWNHALLYLPRIQILPLLPTYYAMSIVF